ncbi:TatD family hydrolase [Hydrotalea sp.]|uniref:TatD family hydrolase n=1 Tax=Hydrotalea sp. TaxID=2881279 RepID=UPI0026209EE0|nr:TatD family hydrolase [Hydrotalea sp.]
MLLTDTHTHLYVEEFNADRDAVVQRAISAGITKMFLPAIDAGTYDAMMDMEKKYPEHCFAMMGLHPCSVNENVNNALQIVEEWLTKRPFAAIGEIGLDFYWDKTFTQQQYNAFDRQMQWALEKKLPVVIHTRNAMQETINRVKPFAQKGLTGIFHCFSGSYESARQIIDMNFSLGIGGVLTYKNAGLPTTLEKIPIACMVLETDAPYLTPVPFRGKRNESSYLQYIAENLAIIKRINLEDLAVITSANAEKIFQV